MDTQRDARSLALQEIAGEIDPEPLEPRSGSTARGTEPQEPGLLATRVPPDAHSGGDTPTAVPEVGEEIRELGLELGTALVQRRTAERRTIFAQRGVLGPDDCPYQQVTFDSSKDYRGVAWGNPVPPEEWERRVYVELNLATDLRHEGKGAKPECHACRVRGSKMVPLAKCIICDNWACLRHLEVPACLARHYPVCAAHPGLEYRPPGDFTRLCKH
eukprot:378530-Amphidinium_carterae.1